MVAPVGSFAPFLAQAQAPALPSLPTGTDPAAPGRSGTGFGTALANAVESLNDKHATADALAVQAATGQLRDVQDYVIAATEAQVATELAVTVRNRAVEAFTSIMQMAI